MTPRSDAAHWPWRKWFMAGAAAAGAVTTLGGPIAVEGGGLGCSCATSGACTAPCAATCLPTQGGIRCDAAGADAREHDGSTKDAETDAATDAPTDSGDAG
jgi:hypothetical protein